jgi:hypothetical protein
MGEAKRRDKLRTTTGESITAAADAANIKVSLTDGRDLHCFRVIVGRPFKGPAFSMLFHGRSLMDLHHKLSLTSMDRNTALLASRQNALADAAAFIASLHHMELSKRFGVDQDLDTNVTHDDNGLFLFDIANIQFSLEMPLRSNYGPKSAKPIGDGLR